MALHRTQVMFEESQHQWLKREAKRSGRSISALLRDLVDRRRGAGSSDEFLEALDASFGVWRDRQLDGYEWVEHARGGLDRPIEDAGW